MTVFIAGLLFLVGVALGAVLGYKYGAKASTIVGEVKSAATAVEADVANVVDKKPGA